MASPTRWTWVWGSSRSWWWTGKPGVLQPMGSKRVGHHWATELNWTWGRDWVNGGGRGVGRGWKSVSDMMSRVRWCLLTVIMNETEAQVRYVMEIQECWTRELQSFRNLILILNPGLGVGRVGRKGCTASSHLILLPHSLLPWAPRPPPLHPSFLLLKLTPYSENWSRRVKHIFGYGNLAPHFLKMYRTIN